MALHRDRGLFFALLAKARSCQLGARASYRSRRSFNGLLAGQLARRARRIEKEGLPGPTRRGSPSEEPDRHPGQTCNHSCRKRASHIQRWQKLEELLQAQKPRTKGGRKIKVGLIGNEFLGEG